MGINEIILPLGLIFVLLVMGFYFKQFSKTKKGDFIMYMLLDSTPKNNVWNYVLIGVVALLLIALPILMNQKNKKESQKIQEQTNSLKVGDKVLTTSGVYGTITEIKFDDSQKLVVIETGGKNKSYLSVDAYAIYTVFKSEVSFRLCC